MKSEVKLPIDSASETEANWIKVVQDQVRSLRFGVVQIVVHESRVVHIERTEKIRFTPVPNRSAS